MSMVYHVAKTGSNRNDGSQQMPFLTINTAAALAKPGDTVMVHEGEYREWVTPRAGGHSPARRITYQAAPGEKVLIKGSERVQTWERVAGDVWQAVLPNALFGSWNPYEKTIAGDWLVYPEDRHVHLGDVYLNGKSFYEAESLEAVSHPVKRTEALEFWSKRTVPVADPEQTLYLWYAKVEEESTTITANFGGADPNVELVEVNVRKCCFYPQAAGMDYITVRGFELCHAATPWAPPTADQPGLIGPNWSKGWIIEDNIIHDAKCSAVSIGKEVSTGNNWHTCRMDKSGHQYQLESVFAAQKIGWSKEKIGSHVIRNNTIYNCGQNGIVGHLGCVFSEIYGNNIYGIAIKHEFFGHEIAGIKLHAGIDVQIHHNRIHSCTLGTWMDWQTQGTRISKNVFYHNDRDLFIEVSHGPYLVDHNILADAHALDNMSQGGAYVGNLVAGVIYRDQELGRCTPYHAPHSTDVAGYAKVYSGDDRWYQNLFVGLEEGVQLKNEGWGGAACVGAGTAGYSGRPTSLDAYVDKIKRSELGDPDRYAEVPQPAYIDGNVYLQGARAFEGERNRLERADFKAAFSIEETEDALYLNITLPDGFEACKSAPHTTRSLGQVRIVNADFENPDGSQLKLNSDLLDAMGDETVVAGPIYALRAGKNRIKIMG